MSSTGGISPTSAGRLSPTASGTPGGTARRKYVRTSDFRDSVRTPIGKEFSVADEDSQDPLITAASNSRGMDNGGASATLAAKMPLIGSRQPLASVSQDLPTPHHFLATHNLASSTGQPPPFERG